MNNATATVREHPILFSGPMVKAILEGRKTETRRVIKHPGDFLGGGGKSNREEWDDPRRWGWEDPENPTHFIVLARNPEPGSVPVRCPYGKSGDQLYVKETWALVKPWHEPDFGYIEDFEEWVSPLPKQKPKDWVVMYRADWGSDHNHPDDRLFRWRPSIHMPRWASRLTLEITAIRVERLQEISLNEVIAEGIEPVQDGPHANQYWREETGAKFIDLWDKINGSRDDCSWEANPFVWVIGFRRIDPAPQQKANL
jgi:hypothetical protein